MEFLAVQGRLFTLWASVVCDSIKGKTYNAFLICIMFLFTLFNFLLGCSNLQCTIDESIKGAASQRRYGITFDGNINIIVLIFPKGFGYLRDFSGKFQ